MLLHLLIQPRSPNSPINTDDGASRDPGATRRCRVLENVEALVDPTRDKNIHRSVTVAIKRVFSVRSKLDCARNYGRRYSEETTLIHADRSSTIEFTLAQSRYRTAADCNTSRQRDTTTSIMIRPATKISYVILRRVQLTTLTSVCSRAYAKGIRESTW